MSILYLNLCKDYGIHGTTQTTAVDLVGSVHGDKQRGPVLVSLERGLRGIQRVLHPQHLLQKKKKEEEKEGGGGGGERKGAAEGVQHAQVLAYSSRFLSFSSSSYLLLAVLHECGLLHHVDLEHLLALSQPK